jgi:hypothetical protein
MFDLLTCSYSDTFLHGESFPVDGAVRWNAGLCGTRELDSENDEVASEERAFFGAVQILWRGENCHWVKRMNYLILQDKIYCYINGSPSFP